MKQAFTRFLFYLFIAIVITGPFRSSWPDAASTEPLAVKFAFYFTHYGIGWLFWTLLFLAVHETISRTRRRRENAPATEPPALYPDLIYTPPGHENCPECNTSSQIVDRK